MLERNKTNLLDYNVNCWHQCLAFSCHAFFFLFIFLPPHSLLTFRNGSYYSSNTTCFDSLKCVLMWLWHSAMPVFVQILENKRWKKWACLLDPLWFLQPSVHNSCGFVARAHYTPPNPFPPHPTLPSPAMPSCINLPDADVQESTILSLLWVWVKSLLSGCHSLPRPRSHPINCAFINCYIRANMKLWASLPCSLSVFCCDSFFFSSFVLRNCASDSCVYDVFKELCVLV